MATVTQQLYVQQVQAPRCYEYALYKGLPNRATLVFTGVTIATSQYRGHICRFIHAQTGHPIDLAFDRVDIPYVLDTFQIVCMVGAFLLCLLLGWFVANRLNRLFEVPSP